MNTGFNYNTKIFKVSALLVTIFLSGCAEIQLLQDPTKEPKLAITPIGCQVQMAGNGEGMTYIEITVRYNSGKFINSSYIEVLAYIGELRVGMTNHIFNSVNIGETMVTGNLIYPSGRPWNRWKSTGFLTDTSVKMVFLRA